MEFAPILAELGADAMLISLAKRNEDSSSSTSQDARSGSVSGLRFGTVTDQIEIVTIRTGPPD
jgi:hypothetical protein